MTESETAAWTWGVWDSQERCWLGSDEGPKRLPTEALARVAAQIVGIQMGYRPGRIEARLFTDPVVVLKDTLVTTMTPREALKKAEDGAL